MAQRFFRGCITKRLLGDKTYTIKVALPKGRSRYFQISDETWSTARGHYGLLPKEPPEDFKFYFQIDKGYWAINLAPIRRSGLNGITWPTGSASISWLIAIVACQSKYSPKLYQVGLEVADRIGSLETGSWYFFGHTEREFKPGQAVVIQLYTNYAFSCDPNCPVPVWCITPLDARSPGAQAELATRVPLVRSMSPNPPVPRPVSRSLSAGPSATLPNVSPSSSGVAGSRRLQSNSKKLEGRVTSSIANGRAFVCYVKVRFVRVEGHAEWHVWHYYFVDSAAALKERSTVTIFVPANCKPSGREDQPVQAYLRSF